MHMSASPKQARFHRISPEENFPTKNFSTHCLLLLSFPVRSFYVVYGVCIEPSYPVPIDYCDLSFITAAHADSLC